MVRRLVAAAAVCCALTGVVVQAVPGAAAAGAGPLKVIAQDPDPAPAGEVATVRALVVNEGSARSEAFTVVVTLPEGVTPEGPFFPENCSAERQTVTCHYRRGLPAGNTATAIVPARLAADATGVLEGGTVTVGEDTAPGALDTGSFAVTVSDEVLTE
ncbi:hypothetical protein ACIA8O_16220 [Kitasatospora sp. NPDC051853]|uniref:hypothetical protein n=1 Tax=Kitasatospora sp. NPDC051853 TaxID=3364058 RepID=UPI003796805E